MPKKQKKPRKPRKLKIWNGGGWFRSGKRRPFEHAYVCAYSQKHAVELLQQAGNTVITLNDLRVYWSSNCWGRGMDGIKPEIGVWITEEFDSIPERLI